MYKLNMFGFVLSVHVSFKKFVDDRPGSYVLKFRLIDEDEYDGNLTKILMNTKRKEALQEAVERFHALENPSLYYMSLHFFDWETGEDEPVREGYIQTSYKVVFNTVK